MNPKDQSRLDLMLRFRDVDVPRAAFWDNPTVAEINSRLVERDALRKENEELRDVLIDARSWMDAGMFEDVPPQYTAMVANVDAMLSKESEASHE